MWGDLDVRCIRCVGLWSLHVNRGVDAIEVARVMGKHSHNSERAAPYCMCVAMWGRQWKGMTVKCQCDNAAVVAIINSGRSRNERAMHLMRSLFFFLANYNVILKGEHLPGVDNREVDALSRDDHATFLAQVPTALPI